MTLQQDQLSIWPATGVETAEELELRARRLRQVGNVDCEYYC